MRIEITPMPADVRQLVGRNNLSAPRACYSNCMNLVFSFATKERKLKYVLVEATYKDESPQAHAVIADNAHYYDPTLEQSGHASDTRYTLVKEFEFPEIVQLVFARYGKDRARRMIYGEEPMCILVNDGNGGFALEP